MTDNLPVEPIDRDTLFALELFKDPSNVSAAAIRAGFPESTANQGFIYSKVKSPAFQELLKQTAIANDFKHLALVYGIEDKALTAAYNEAVIDDKTAITNISKLKHILKQKKQITGILRDDIQPPKTTTINIQELRLIHSNLLPDTGIKAQDIVTVTPVDDD